MTITIDIPVDIPVPEGAEAEAKTLAQKGAFQALRQRFAPAPMPTPTRLDSLLGKIGTFDGKPRPDGKAWSEMEVPCESGAGRP